MTSAPSRVDVQPSAIHELAWALYRMQTAGAAGQAVELGLGLTMPRSLCRRVAEFWADGGTTFGELSLLAYWAACVHDVDVAPLLERLPETLATARFRELGLSSDRPDERAVLERRIRRLAEEPEVRVAYQDLLATVWAAIAPRWRAEGLPAVLAECASWRGRLAAGRPLVELLPADHAVFGLGLTPLLDAALARNEVVVTPCCFVTRGHVLDLPAVLSVGVSCGTREVVQPYHSEAIRAARFSRLLANPTRAAIVLMLNTSAASVADMAGQLDISPTTVRRHLQPLRLAGVIEREGAAPGAPYRAIPDGVDSVLNEVSGLLQRGHGRSTRLRADQASADASFHAIFDRAPIAMLQLDLDGRCISCNQAAQTLFGYSESELSQLRGTHLLADDADQGAFALGSEALADQGYRDIRLRRRDGTTFWSALTMSVVHDKSGRPCFGYAMIEKTANRRGAEDAVTGLPNRALFTTRLERLLTLSRRAGEMVALLMLDLDGFKLVNDEYGHAAGDELLKQVGVRLASSLRATDIIARLGGDEFVVIPSGIATRANAEMAAQKVRKAMSEPFVLSDRRVATVGASVGVAMSPEDGDTVDELLEAADAAMYAAKRSRHATAVQARPVASS